MSLIAFLVLTVRWASELLRTSGVASASGSVLSGCVRAEERNHVQYHFCCLFTLKGSVSAPVHVCCVGTSGKGVLLQIAFSECLHWLHGK